MSYSLTPEQTLAINDVHLAFGCTDLLPPTDAIPEEFHNSRNIYVQVVNSIFYGTEMPESSIEFREGFEQEACVRTVRAHLKSWSPKHEHKMAGVAYMLSLMAELRPTEQKRPAPQAQ